MNPKSPEAHITAVGHILGRVDVLAAQFGADFLVQSGFQESRQSVDAEMLEDEEC